MTTTDEIKKNIDLADYVRSRGITLVKHGRNDLKGLCPFHDDRNPSMIVTPSKGLFHCPACGAGGSVIDFAAKIKNTSVKEAIKELSTSPSSRRTPTAKKRKDSAEIAEEKTRLSPERSAELLERVISFYEKSFANSADGGKSYLESRGVTDAGLFTKHRLGYADGSLLNALPREGRIIEDLKTLGVLLDNGFERFKGCVVFPVLDVEGEITTLYGRGAGAGRRHVYLPDRPTGLFNVGIIKTYPEIVLVESCIDALSLEMSGVGNVVSIQSTNGLSEKDAALLAGCEVRGVTLLLDGDKAGRDAGARLLDTLSDRFTVRNIPLPERHDPNSYLREFGPEKLLSLLAAPSTGEGKKNPSDPVKRTENGFSVTRGLREYAIIGLERKPRSLKATVRVMKAGKIHVDTIDFYSSRQRRQLSQDVCNAFEELPDTINADIAKLLEICESRGDDEKGSGAKSGDDGADERPVMTPAETREAESFGREKDLVGRISKDYETCGLIGEESNKLLCYLAMTSRKMVEPLSVLILSSSGAGKTALQDAALNFCPPEDLVKLTSLSAKALFYKERTSLKHKVLAIEEGAGAEDATYAIRNLISSDGLSSEVAVRDPRTGKLTTMSNRVEGPLSVFCTTTDPEVDPETRSRFLVTGVDESRGQTRRILEFQKQRHSLNALHVNSERVEALRIHRNFQRSLKPVAVVNPRVDKLSYSDDRLQGRRAQPQYLNIINTVAFLRQMSKEIKIHECSSSVPPSGTTADEKHQKVEYVEVDETDIQIGHELAVEILGKTLDELSIPARDLLELIDKMLSARLAEIIKKDGRETSAFKRDLTFTRRELREFSGWTQTRLRNHLKELVDLEYVLIDSGMNGRVLQSYKLVYDGEGGHGGKFIPGLKT